MEFNLDISKEKALELLDEQIAVFSRLESSASYAVEAQEEYLSAVANTKRLLNRLYQDDAGGDFEVRLLNIVALYSWRVGGRVPPSDKKETFFKRIRVAKRELTATRKEVDEFWPKADSGPMRPGHGKSFVSKSFAEQDKSLNNYFESILSALGIEFTTGESYSKESIPKKIENRILQSDLLIAIVTGRKKTVDGQYTHPSWISREFFFAKGKEKDLIILHEKDVEELAGMKGEKQIIYFDRNNIEMMQTATVTFLQALKDHNLV